MLFSVVITLCMFLYIGDLRGQISRVHSADAEPSSTGIDISRLKREIRNEVALLAHVSGFERSQVRASIKAKRNQLRQSDPTLNVRYEDLKQQESILKEECNFVYELMTDTRNKMHHCMDFNANNSVKYWQETLLRLRNEHARAHINLANHLAFMHRWKNPERSSEEYFDNIDPGIPDNIQECTRVNFPIPHEIWRQKCSV